jgi:exodeoxyribonuclease-5
MTIYKDQDAAWSKLMNWIKGDKPYFILAGYAGTGKSYLMGKFAQKDIANVYFSATTNKATKVLTTIVKKRARTIYSLLGLKMVENEDKLELSPYGKPPYFPPKSIIVIDEASMVNSNLLKIIEDFSWRLNIRFIFVGDPAQLPPVGEDSSLVWKITKDKDCVAALQQVVRNDNELLNLATEVRSCITSKNFISPIRESNSDGKGIFILPSQEQFEEMIIKNTPTIDFSETKVIAWRNVTVDYYNSIIRSTLGYDDVYCEGEIILLSKPVEEENVIVASVDDEFIIKKIDKSSVRVDNNYIDSWCLSVENGLQKLTLYIPENYDMLNAILRAKAEVAKIKVKKREKNAWGDYWNVVKMFHEVRYGYALTAHRIQGSTLKDCYIDQMDILGNFKEKEAFKCLYVAVTRPTNKIYTF